MRSKDPSGGMNDIVLSFSNRANRTHLYINWDKSKFKFHPKYWSWQGQNLKITISKSKYQGCQQDTTLRNILVELDIIKIYGFPLCSPTLSLQKYSVIQPKLALWHPTEQAM